MIKNNLEQLFMSPGKYHYEGAYIGFDEFGFLDGCMRIAAHGKATIYCSNKFASTWGNTDNAFGWPVVIIDDLDNICYVAANLDTMPIMFRYTAI